MDIHVSPRRLKVPVLINTKTSCIHTLLQNEIVTFIKASDVYHLLCNIYLVLVLSSLKGWYFLFVLSWFGTAQKSHLCQECKLLTILFWKKKNGSLLNNWINLHWREFSCVCEAYFRVHQIMEVATKVKAIIFQGQDQQFWRLSLSLKYWGNQKREVGKVLLVLSLCDDHLVSNQQRQNAAVQ